MAASPRTPMLSSRSAARAVEEKTGVRLAPGGTGDDARLFLKAEHLQVTGSFKARGATNRVLRCPRKNARAG